MSEAQGAGHSLTTPKDTARGQSAANERVREPPDGDREPVSGCGLSRRTMITHSALGAGLLAYTTPVIAQATAQGALSPTACEDGCAPGQVMGAVVPTTPVQNDIPVGDITGGGLTRIRVSDVSISGCVYLVDENSWRITVTAASTTIHWGIRTNFYTEPILPPAGGSTITCGNVQAAIDDMTDYEATQGAGPNWHMAAASTAHEMDHVNRFKPMITGAWPAIQAAIELHKLGTCPPMTKAQAEAAMATYLATQEVAWFNAYGVPGEATAYAAGQAILDAKIVELEAWKTANCP